tara:strand:- start:187 stop:477 length:291 start_codon:yes stop_codon:yes gene_type:complete
MPSLPYNLNYGFYSMDNESDDNIISNSVQVINNKVYINSIPRFEAICPHCKCGLKYNRKEHTLICLCNKCSYIPDTGVVILGSGLSTKNLKRIKYI